MSGQQSQSIRIVIADDHPLTRAGLRKLLAEISGVEIVGEADNGRVALELARNLRPDLMLLDIEMPEMTGVEVARQLKEDGSEVRIIALSAFDYREYVYGILESGAKGYIKKEEADLETLEVAIAHVMEDGEMWISQTLATHLVRANIKEHEMVTVLQTLSEREKEVLKLVGRGRGNPEIAEQLFISVNTVKNHVDHIRQKLEIRTRNELIAWAWERKVVKSD